MKTFPGAGIDGQAWKLFSFYIVDWARTKGVVSSRLGDNSRLRLIHEGNGLLELHSY